MTATPGIGPFTPPFGRNILVARAVCRTPLPVHDPGLLPIVAINIISPGSVTVGPDRAMPPARALARAGCQGGDPKRKAGLALRNAVRAVGGVFIEQEN